MEETNHSTDCPGLGNISPGPWQSLVDARGVDAYSFLPSFLQVLKSTGDVVAGRALYEGYAAVTDAPPERFLTLRDTVLLRKESRKLIVQPNTRLEGNAL